MDELAADWLKRYDNHNTNAMCDLVNFVLKCTGCDLQVDVHDIEDPDNVASKLQDLQDEYQAQKLTDYPLISKARSGPSFRATMTGFFQSLIATSHASGLLYNDLVLIENIQVWVSTMSSSAIRPFRHTATVVSLTIATTVCSIMNEIVDNTAKTIRQKEGEQKKKPVNKERVAALQAKVHEGEKRRELAEGWLRDVFDAVFMHRYRDVDPRIRVECVVALGTWITTCSDIFFEGQYLRYLGWVLSDTSAPTRAEVIKQLAKLFKHKENVGRLRAFTERFRPRIVEMAAQDADPTIRASAVELLDKIRDVGLLEPDDIDTIGRLIFDTEPRVRKAVSKFFVENINDLFESTIEDLGGEDGLEEALGEEVDDDYDNPRKAWVKLKCLTEVLRSYDIEDGDEDATEREPRNSRDVLVVTGVDSRYSLATKAIYEQVSEVKEWEVIAGYLLYDHSSATDDNAGEDPQRAFKVRCQLSGREEIVLLEILNAAVKLRLLEAIDSSTDKKSKKTKARKEESREIQETTALHLAQVIPRLLKKFGANPATASAVLRLEHLLNLEIFQELRQDSTEYASLLDDINKQFLTHADGNVLAEASTALLHARSFEDLEEVTEGKLQELWDDTIGALRALAKKPSGSAKGRHLTDLSNTVHRISSLASISDCVTIFDGDTRPTSKGPSKPGAKVREILLGLMKSYAGVDDTEADTLVTNTMRAMLFYYMWTVHALREKISAGEQIGDVTHKEDFSAALASVISTKGKLDHVRLTAIGTLLDLYTLFATFRHLKVQQTAGNKDLDASASVAGLVQEVTPGAQGLITSSFIAAEKAFAKRSKRTIEPPAEDESLDDLESEPEDDSDDENEADDEEAFRRNQQRQQDVLLAEKRLCELSGKMVLALVGRVLDASGPAKGSLRKRLQRNQVKLGANFKEVLAYLDGPKPKKSHKAKATGKGKEAGNERAAEKSKAVITEDDEDDEGEAEDVVEEGDEEDLRRRELVEDRVEGGSGGEAGRGEASSSDVEDHVMGD